MVRYENELTPESKFVNQLDKLETFIQLIDYEKDNPAVKMNNIYAWAKKKITHPILLKLLEEADMNRLAKPD